MKKVLLLTTTFLFIAITGVSHAQLQEGNFMLGTDIGSGLTNPTSNGLFSMNFGLNEGAGFDLGISPKVGYFVTDDFLIGAIVNLGFTKSPEVNGESAKTTVYGIQALTRFYVSPGEADLDDVVPAGQFFLETNAGIAGIYVADGISTNGFAFGFGPGYSLFLNESVALEANIKYNGLVGAGNANFQHALGINLGIQVFLPFSDAEDTIEEFE